MSIVFQNPNILWGLTLPTFFDDLLLTISGICDRFGFLPAAGGARSEVLLDVVCSRLTDALSWPLLVVGDNAVTSVGGCVLQKSRLYVRK